MNRHAAQGVLIISPYEQNPKETSKPFKLATGFPRMPRRAPGLLVGIARRGAAGMPHVGEGAGSPFRQPPPKALERRKQAASGWLFFW